MDTVYYHFCFSSEKHRVFDLEGRIEVTVSSYGEPARINCLPEHADPGSPVEFELGDIEVIAGEKRDENGHFIWHYAPMPNDDLGKALDQMIRDDLKHDDIRAAALDSRWDDENSGNFDFHAVAMKAFGGVS